MRRIFLSLAAIFILSFLASCLSSGVSPFGQEQGLQLQKNEKTLWRTSEVEEKKLNESGRLYQDSVAENYLNEIAQKLLPDEDKQIGLPLHIKIIKNPLLNAFSLPNGGIYIHTGILSEIKNEAQLATLLGHEMTHVINRHALQNYQTVTNTSTVLSSLQVLGLYGDLIGIFGSIGGKAAISGFSRDLESEADQNGLELMSKKGYDPREAPKLFEYLLNDTKESGIKEPFFFGSHPKLQERIENYTRILAAQFQGASGVKGEEPFTSIMRPVVIENARLNLAKGNFVSSERNLSYVVDKDPANSIAHYYLGETYRQRNGKQEDLMKAENEYRLSLKSNSRYPEPYKGLGFVFLKKGSNDEARKAFNTYLSLSPAASDRNYILQYIQ